MEGVTALAGSGAVRGLRVLNVFDSSPAKESGIRKGDLIVGVNGRSLAGVNSELATARIKGKAGTLDFDWPVPVDLYPLKADLPKQFKDASNSVTAMGSRVALTFAEGVTPRYYQLSPRQFVVDIDVSPEEGLKAALAAEDAEKQARAEAALRRMHEIDTELGEEP